MLRILAVAVLAINDESPKKRKPMHRTHKEIEGDTLKCRKQVNTALKISRLANKSPF